jgi:hypothetical protein
MRTSHLPSTWASSNVACSQSTSTADADKRTHCPPISSDDGANFPAFRA